MQLDGKIAVITGGASGIGRGIAEEFIARGATVVIADIERSTLDLAAAALGAHGMQCDVSDAASVQALADETVARFGRIDILCNNAGVGSMAPLEKMTLDDWRWMLGVNLWGTIHCVHAFLPHITANPHGGHITATASIGGFAVMPNLGAYAVSKFGVVALMEALKAEMDMAGRPVGVTILAPGTIRSNIATSRRNRPVTLDAGGLADVDLDDIPEAFDGHIPWKEPREAGRVLAEAIEQGRLYATTHVEMTPAIFARQRRIEEELGQSL